MTARRARGDLQWHCMKLFFFLAVFMGFLGLISLRTAIVNLKYELNELENQKIEFLRLEKLLEAEKARVYSVENIEKSARSLGMNVVKRENIIYVKEVAGAVPHRASTTPIPWDN